MICSRNQVPKPGSNIPYLVPNLGDYYQFSTTIIQNTTNFGLYLHLFMMSYSIVALIAVHEEHGHHYATHNQIICLLHCQLFHQWSVVTDTVQNAHYSKGTLLLVDDLLPT